MQTLQTANSKGEGMFARKLEKRENTSLMKTGLNKGAENYA